MNNFFIHSFFLRRYSSFIERRCTLICARRSNKSITIFHLVLVVPSCTYLFLKSKEIKTSNKYSLSISLSSHRSLTSLVDDDDVDDDELLDFDVDANDDGERTK